MDAKEITVKESQIIERAKDAFLKGIFIPYYGDYLIRIPYVAPIDICCLEQRPPYRPRYGLIYEVILDKNGEFVKFGAID